ncbi:MAG: flotillin family protein [Maricaulaceae bacterium]
MPENIGSVAGLVGAVLFVFLLICYFFARLYKRASKELSFVRTGLGGQKVIINGGSIVLPIVHDTIAVNMNTLRLEVARRDQHALITRDRMRVDVLAEFYVRVQPTIESIAAAAQTLGKRTMDPEALKDLVEGKFVDALRAVAAESSMEELHEQRVKFVQKVQAAVSEDLLKNGLELESVSLTGLDQTRKEFFNPDNAFDAQGLTKLTQEIEERRRLRNEIEQDTEVDIRRKNLEAERQTLEIQRETEYAKLDQEREIAVRAAEQRAQVSSEEAQRNRDAEDARITAEQQVREREIEKERTVAEREIEKARAVEAAEVEKTKLIKIAEEDRAIAVAEKSRERSEADARADEARALAAKAAEEVTTAREVEIAERDKRVQIVEAERVAEMEAISVKVAAEAHKAAATDEAEATRIQAEGEAQAERLKAEAEAVKYKVRAEGERAVNEAANALSAEQIAMQIRLALIEQAPSIISEQVKPLQSIDGIKIVQMDGLTGSNGPTAPSSHGQQGGLADSVVDAALRYRAQSPLIDSLLGELGLEGASLKDLTAPARPSNSAPLSADQFDDSAASDGG